MERKSIARMICFVMESTPQADCKNIAGKGYGIVSVDL
jgi:hypothetical protein